MLKQVAALAAVVVLAGLLGAVPPRALGQVPEGTPEHAALAGLARFYGRHFGTAQTAQECAVNIDQQRAYFQLMEGWVRAIQSLPSEFHRVAAEATVMSRQRFALMARELRCETARDEHTAAVQALQDALRR